MLPSWFSSNRLTPEPEGGRRGIVKADDRVGETTLRGWARENKRGVFEAIRRKIVLPDHYCLRSHQERVDLKPPKPSDPGWRQESTLEFSSSKPTVIVDHNGVVAVWVFPGFLSGHSLDYVNDFTTANAEYEFPKADRDKGIIRGAKSNGKSRGGVDTYTTTHGIWGTATYCTAWHEQVHQHDKSFAPSKDLIGSRTVAQAVQRDYYFCSWRDIHWKINDLVSLVHPELHATLLALRSHLVDHPSCQKILSTWESLFPGHSLICNRATGEHIDKSGIRRGLEVILAHGDFTGGALFLKDINVRIEFLPGTLVLLDGTSQRHKIEPWSGPQRFSNAFFTHRSVLAELNIRHTLPNVTIGDIESRLSQKAVAPARHSHTSTPVPPHSIPSKRRRSYNQPHRSQSPPPNRQRRQ